MRNHIDLELTSEQLATATGGQQSVQDLTLGQVVDVAKLGGCLDATYQAGMAAGRKGLVADNRLIQYPDLPGTISRGQRLVEATAACKQGGSY